MAKLPQSTTQNLVIPFKMTFLVIGPSGDPKKENQSFFRQLFNYGVSYIFRDEMG